MVSLKPRCMSRFSEEVKMKRKKQKSSKRGIATAFTPGLLKLNSRNDSSREDLLNIYHQVLTVCGFNIGATRSRRPVTWKVTCTPSNAFEVQLTLDSDMSLVKMEERSLNWVHGTILAGVNQCFNSKDLQCSSDVRMHICTADTVKEDSPLYKDVLPEIKGRRIFPIDVKDGKPIISPLLAKKSKQLVNAVRHVQTLQMYTNGSIDASIVYGESYFGEKLVLNRPFCELSLYFDSEKLIKCINEYLDEELLKELVVEYFQTSLLIQKTLEKSIPMK